MPTNHHGFPTQRRIVQLFHRGVKGVEVGVQYMPDNSGVESIAFGRPI
jgi:hypothetical protein